MSSSSPSNRLVTILSYLDGIHRNLPSSKLPSPDSDSLPPLRPWPHLRREFEYLFPFPFTHKLVLTPALLGRTLDVFSTLGGPLKENEEKEALSWVARLVVAAKELKEDLKMQQAIPPHASPLVASNIPPVSTLSSLTADLLRATSYSLMETQNATASTSAMTLDGPNTLSPPRPTPPMSTSTSSFRSSPFTSASSSYTSVFSSPSPIPSSVIATSPPSSVPRLSLTSASPTTSPTKSITLPLSPPPSDRASSSRASSPLSSIGSRSPSPSHLHPDSAFDRIEQPFLPTPPRPPLRYLTGSKVNAVKNYMKPRLPFGSFPPLSSTDKRSKRSPSPPDEDVPTFMKSCEEEIREKEKQLFGAWLRDEERLRQESDERLAKELASQEVKKASRRGGRGRRLTRRARQAKGVYSEDEHSQSEKDDMDVDVQAEEEEEIVHSVKEEVIKKEKGLVPQPAPKPRPRPRGVDISWMSDELKARRFGIAADTKEDDVSVDDMAGDIEANEKTSIQGEKRSVTNVVLPILKDPVVRAMNKAILRERTTVMPERERDGKFKKMKLAIVKKQQVSLTSFVSAQPDIPGSIATPILPHSLPISDATNRSTSEIRQKLQRRTVKISRYPASLRRSGRATLNLEISADSVEKDDDLDSLSSLSDVESVLESDSDLSSVDETWCVCEGPGYGVMIECDNSECAIGWFHIECTSLECVPESNEDKEWLCDYCGKKDVVVHVAGVRRAFDAGGS